MQWATETWSGPQLKQDTLLARTENLSRNTHHGGVVATQGLTHAFRATQGATAVQNSTPHVPVACRYPYYNNNLDPAAASFAATYHEDFSAWNSFDLASHQRGAFHFASTPGAGVNPSPVMGFAHLPGHRSAGGYTFGVAGGEYKSLLYFLYNALDLNMLRNWVLNIAVFRKSSEIFKLEMGFFSLWHIFMLNIAYNFY